MGACQEHSIFRTGMTPVFLIYCKTEKGGTWFPVSWSQNGINWQGIGFKGKTFLNIL